MKISIITVSYNAQATIAETISSVACQTHGDIEYIIIDGASTDQTCNVILSHPQYKKITRFISEADYGVYDAMNKGIKIASGDVIGLLNSDDIYFDNTVLTQVAEVFSDPLIDACYADLIYVKEFDSSKVVRYWKSKDYRAGLFEKGWMPAHPTFFVRKRVYERYGAFNLQYKIQADFELTLRFLSAKQIKTCYVSKIWVKMRMGGISNRSLLGSIIANMESYKACKEHELSISIAPLFIIRKMISRAPQFFNLPK
ncbi:glycosyltransferase [Polynucleobacter paneuropaeus]|uniref:glycosyltransferase family 2 protein n=1 Tax=Polynucleobacter paneuropaeus TaxID=2527775 RepID=UPI000DBF1ABA|nr:glycosyltransferase family 2 protein [Polynucleobacter paneuropaeus]AWW47466.1 glycosyltransferase [Polynucleobacter paneuropaeus]